MVVNDGAFHAVDSSEMAFRTATKDAFRSVLAKAKPVIMEPIMKVLLHTHPTMQLLNHQLMDTSFMAVNGGGGGTLRVGGRFSGSFRGVKKFPLKQPSAQPATATASDTIKMYP